MSSITNSDIQSLPFTLNANHVASVLGISKNAAYTLMHSEGFPTIHVGKRLLVQRDKFFLWMDVQSNSSMPQ